MSNTTRYDSLLTLHLARELNARFAGRACTFAAFERERGHFVLGCDEDGIRWDMRTGIPEVARVSADDSAKLPLPKRPIVAEIVALPDERIIRIALTGGQRSNAIRFFVIELLPVGRNAIALDAGRRVVKLLVRATSARTHVRGQPYAPPVSRERIVIDSMAEWRPLFAAQPATWRDSYIDQVAYASPINAPAVLPDGATLESAYQRYKDLRTANSTAYRLVQPAGQTYPHALWQDASPMPSLIAALNQLEVPEPHEAGTRLEREVDRLERKRERLEQEVANAQAIATQLRREADVIMANAHAIERGTEHVELLDFEGEPISVQLDRARSAIENEQERYDAARKRERAADRLPEMIAGVDREILEKRALLARVHAGEQVELPPPPPGARKPGTDAPALPYRHYTTSGGLEVRVGRSSRANDDLTFHHSSPNDIWLHARDVGGAHVVLRWSNPTDNPPRKDLVDAAILAAQHSKARHSRTVPVDWTRRKYVRKPRGAPPGQVRLERAETLFVQLGDG